MQGSRSALETLGQPKVAPASSSMDKVALADTKRQPRPGRAQIQTLHTTSSLDVLTDRTQWRNMGDTLPCARTSAWSSVQWLDLATPVQVHGTLRRNVRLCKEGRPSPPRCKILAHLCETQTIKLPRISWPSMTVLNAQPCGIVVLCLPVNGIDGGC